MVVAMVTVADTVESQSQKHISGYMVVHTGSVVNVYPGRVVQVASRSVIL